MSLGVKKFLSQFGFSKENDTKHDLPSIENNEDDDDLLDVSKIVFDNDETWLYKPDNSTKLNTSASLLIKQTENDMNSKESNNTKYINTQTFTRPKKKLLRQSIEKYNQDMYLDEQLPSSPESPSFLNKTITKEQTPTKPLQFDLTQSENSHYFEKLAANIDSEDTFQNMSPPSLVNSMCSSTFTTLMESSFIKNDPLLKQICDTDFTTSILSQGSEPPSLIQSFNYSTNSVDDFLNKVSQDDILNKIHLNNLKCSGDTSYIVSKHNEYDDENRDFENIKDVTITAVQNQHNGTYRKNNRLSSATFRKTDFKRSIGRNQTYEIDQKDIEEAQNITRTINIAKCNDTIVKSNSLENFKNTTIIKDSCNNELNRYEDNLNEPINKRSESKKSLECSIGSADSLDRMSTLSSSSKGSNKMLNMEDVEAIAEKQAQSLQIISTPKPNPSNRVLNRIMWDQSVISPIVTSDLHSDSGDSSDEYKSVKSTLSKNSTEANTIKQTRSLVSLQDPKDARKLKSINTLINHDHLYKIPSRGGGSSTNLQKFNTIDSKATHIKVNSTGSINTNLKTMKSSLKGSYTSLRPVNTHLPVAPPINNPAQKTYVAPPAVQVKNLTKGNENTAKLPGDGVFVKPSSGPFKSGLPRPTVSSTNIPRPMSKIPGPKRFK